jgi:hypothetical protein
MDTQLKFRCPECHVRLMAEADHAGLNDNCPDCNATITVPVSQALVPVVRRAKPPEVIPADDDFELDVPRRRRHRDDDDKPVELRLGNMVGMKADVDRKTRNAMATTFLGGLLVALGAIIFSMFGGKSKSS